MPSEILADALNYAEIGWRVFPCKPGTKVPHGELAPHGCHSASTDADLLRAWWSRSPLSPVAIATGAPGPDVVDFDVTAGKPGAISHRRLDAGRHLSRPCLIVATPSGGRHFYYAGSAQGNGSMPRHGVDFRGAGGYVVAPPSPGYVVLAADPDTAAGIDFSAVRRVLEPPRPATPALRPDPGNHEALVLHVARLAEGNRNAGLFWAACRAVEGGAGPDVFRALVAAAVSVGLTEREASATVRSAQRRPIGVTA